MPQRPVAEPLRKVPIRRFYCLPLFELATFAALALPAALATLLRKDARLVTETGGAFWLPCFLAAGGSQAAFLKSGRFYFAGLRFPTFAAGGAGAPTLFATLRLLRFVSC